MRRFLIGLALAALATSCKAPKPEIYSIGEIKLDATQGPLIKAKVTVNGGQEAQGLAVTIGGEPAERLNDEPSWFKVGVLSLDMNAFGAWKPKNEPFGREELDLDVVATNRGESEQRSTITVLNTFVRRVMAERLARVAQIPLKQAPELKRAQGTRPRVEVHSGICEPAFNSWFKEEPARVALQGGAQKVGDAELVLVTCKQMSEREKCSGYSRSNGGGGGVTVDIFQSEVIARLFVARSGEKLAEKSFQGAVPTCPMFVSARSNQGLLQESGGDPSEDQIRAWKDEVTR